MGLGSEAAVGVEYEVVTHWVRNLNTSQYRIGVVRVAAVVGVGRRTRRSWKWGSKRSRKQEAVAAVAIAATEVTSKNSSILCRELR